MSVHLLSNAKLDVRETPVGHPSRPRKRAALRLVSTKDMARDDWLEVRRTGTPPPGDGSDSAEKALRCLYPNSGGDEVDMRDNPELNATFEALLLAREQLDSVQKREARLRQAIQIHMGEAGKAIFACGGSVTWRRSKDGQSSLGASHTAPGSWL